MTKLIWSLDTFPITNNRWEQGNRFKDTLIMNSLSFLYAHLWYDNMEIYVDERAHEILKVLPFKFTVTEFERVPYLWMNGKLQVMEQQKVPFVHIDGDIFLKKPVAKLNKFNNILVERKEIDDFPSHYKPQIEYLTDYFEGIIPQWTDKLTYSYNCGVFGFNDMMMKDDYIRHYKTAKSIFTEIGPAFKERLPHHEPCITLEQYLLACFTEYRGLKVDMLLQDAPFLEQHVEASKMGYTHLFGMAKYHNQVEMEERFKLCFPYWYDKIMNQIVKFS